MLCKFEYISIYSYFAIYFFQDQLKGDSVTELRVKYIKRLEDAVPAGED